MSATKTQYRVRGRRRDGSAWGDQEHDWSYRKPRAYDVRQLAKRNDDVRVEKRTVTLGPIEPVDLADLD